MNCVSQITSLEKCYAGRFPKNINDEDWSGGEVSPLVSLLLLKAASNSTHSLSEEACQLRSHMHSYYAVPQRIINWHFMYFVLDRFVIIIIMIIVTRVSSESYEDLIKVHWCQQFLSWLITDLYKSVGSCVD